ncbi:F-box/LRR-repeat protein 7-like [Hyalella azteca]|uniref:F-box/LRR-repeat protein 7-like n=1 Tax=Hyalella azteca TaxID=294128 RepID=A0A979FTK2_HYAAZ|nr:F-box/LRR-repeat protein 7-like [Hyalella azteca]
MEPFSFRVENQRNHQEVCEIGDLPNELLTYIFSFLSKTYIYSTIFKVCRHWKNVASHPSLWHTLHFESDNSLGVTEMTEMLSFAPELLFLKIRESENIIPVLQQLSQSCPKLQHLDIGFNSIENKEVIELLVEKCPQIESLNLEGTSAQDPEESVFFPFAALEHLKTLNLCYCKWVTDDFINKLSQSKSSFENLDIDGIPYPTDSSIAKFLEEKGSQIRILKLDGEGLTDISFGKLAKCERLSELSISFSENMTYLSLERIVRNSKLRKLYIRKGTSLAPNGLQQAFSQLNCVLLVSLYLSECHKMDDRTLEILLPKVPLLTKLNLDWCSFISTIGFAHIKTHCSHLKHLGVMGLCRVADSSLSDIPAWLPNLKFLNLTSCNVISDQSIIDLTTLMPDLCVLNYYGEAFVNGEPSDIMSVFSCIL